MRVIPVACIALCSIGVMAWAANPTVQNAKHDSSQAAAIEDRPGWNDDTATQNFRDPKGGSYGMTVPPQNARPDWGNTLANQNFSDPNGGSYSVATAAEEAGSGIGMVAQNIDPTPVEAVTEEPAAQMAGSELEPATQATTMPSMP